MKFTRWKGNSIFRAKKSFIPGFGLNFGISIVYVSFMIVIPIMVMFFRGIDLGINGFLEVVGTDRVSSALALSIGTAFASATFNVILGFLVAWVLERYDFPGRKIIDGLIDIPFALPTAVAGLSLAGIYAVDGFLGSFLYRIGIQVTYTPLGIITALIFVTFPFVVRSIQPVLEGFDKGLEEAAMCLGATRFQTFRKVIFPELVPAIITGFTLAFSRSLGEYGSVVFISGNMPFRTEILPLLIRTKLEQHDYEGSIAIASVMLVISFALLLGINLFQWRLKRNRGGVGL